MATLGDRRILVVDDEEMVRRFTALLLKREGYVVFEAENGRVALECLREEEVDLVITDLRMPEMDGLTLLRESRKRYPNMGFMVLTGYSTVQSAVQAIKGGAADFITKPHHLGDLEDKVAAYFEGQEGSEKSSTPLTSRPVQALQEILSQHRDLSDTMAEIIHLIQRTFEPTDMEITVFDERLLEETVVFRGQESEEEGALRVTQGEMEKLVEEPAPWFLGDARDRRRARRTRGHILTVPSFRGGNVLWALTLAREPSEPPYVARDARLLLLFASQLDLAMLHARTRRRLLDATQTLTEVSFSLIENWLEGWGVYDQVTWDHVKRVARYARVLGERLGLSDEELEILSVAGLLHDVGKLGVDDETLNKAEALTVKEFDEVKLHPVMGIRLLEGLPVFDSVLPAVRHHHERLDGDGYPDGLEGEEIPLFARIIAVVDTYDSMVSDRPYRQRLSVDEAMARLRKSAGRQLDGQLVQAWLSLLESEIEKGEVRPWFHKC